MKLFGIRFLQSLVAALWVFFTLGCSQDPDTAKATGDVVVRIPWKNEGQDYQLQNVTLSGIQSLYELAGDYVTFYMAPGIDNNHLVGIHPKARFLNDHGVFVPEDDLSQQLAVIYAHLQRLKDLDNSVGAADLNQGPRDVGVAVHYKNANGADKNNALYEGTTDSILIVPYTLSNLPIAVNAGILGHEHFHSLYFKLVEKKVFKRRLVTHGLDLLPIVGLDGNSPPPAEASSTETESAFNQFYLQNFSRGLNEGLADFWAWVYTGDPDFIAASLPTEREARSLNAAGTYGGIRVINTRLWQNYVRALIGGTSSDNGSGSFSGYTPAGCEGLRLVYCLGTYYSRNLKSFTEVVADTRGWTRIQARKEVASAVVRALPQLADAFLNLNPTEYYEPVTFYQLLASSMTDLQPKEKEFLQNLYQPASIETFPGAKKVTLTAQPIPRDP